METSKTSLNRDLPQPVVRARDLSLAESKTSFDLEIVPGETIALLGARGAGKTRLLRLLAGLERPAAGQVDWSGGSGGSYLSLADHPLTELSQLAGEARLLLLDDLPAGGLPTLAALRPSLPPALILAAGQVEPGLLPARPGQPGLATRILALRRGELVFAAPAAALAPGTPCYRIGVRGRLDPDRAAWFGDLAVLSHGDDTRLAGPVPDQPALFGILARVRDLGLELVTLNPIPGGPLELLRELVGA